MPRRPSDTPILRAYRDAKSGRYRLWLTLRGERTSYPLEATDAESAAAELEDWRKTVLPAILRKASAAPEPAGPTLDALSKWYLETHLRFLGREPKTISKYEGIISNFLIYCRSRHVRRPQQLSTRIVQEWQLWRDTTRKNGESRIARRNELLAIRHWLDEANQCGELNEMVSIKWDIPGKGRSQRYRALSRDELIVFLQTCRLRIPRAYPPIAWAAHTGWLPENVIEFRHEHIRGDVIDWERLKTSERLLLPITAPMREILRLAHTSDGHVFRDGDQPWTYNALQKRLNRATKHMPRPVRFRDLRKTYGTMLALGGCPPNVLAVLMSHADVKMTYEYYVQADVPTIREWTHRYAAWITENSE